MAAGALNYSSQAIVTANEIQCEYSAPARERAKLKVEIEISPCSCSEKATEHADYATPLHKPQQELRAVASPPAFLITALRCRATPAHQIIGEVVRSQAFSVELRASGQLIWNRG
jgi:hypothetical protein